MTPTTHILKPPIPGFPGHCENEHLCLAVAGDLGIPVARSRVGRFGEETAIVVERYDRVKAGGRLARLHQEDFCQALGRSPLNKYESEGGPGCRHWERLAGDVGLPPEEVLGICRSVATEVPDRFADVVATARSEGVEHPVVGRLQQAVSKQARACLDGLRGGYPGLRFRVGRAERGSPFSLQTDSATPPRIDDSP